MARTVRQGATAWTDERIRTELGAFLAGRDEWPTYREFQRAGLKALRDNITRRGGAEHWARELGVPYARHPPGYAPIWTEARIRDGLSRYLAGRRVWPSRDEFERDGHTALRNAINRTGGPDRWAAEFGLERGTRLSGIRRGWTPEVIEAELARLIGGGTTWPTRPEFERAGLLSLLSAVYRHEGLAYWAERMNVEYHAGPVSSPWRLWSEERIRRDLEEFCEGRARWPTEREFVAAGRRALYRAASRMGGIPYWADQLGLPRGRLRA